MKIAELLERFSAAELVELPGYGFLVGFAKQFVRGYQHVGIGANSANERLVGKNISGFQTDYRLKKRTDLFILHNFAEAEIFAMTVHNHSSVQ